MTCIYAVPLNGSSLIFKCRIDLCYFKCITILSSIEKVVLSIIIKVKKNPNDEKYTYLERITQACFQRKRLRCNVRIFFYSQPIIL